MGILGGLVLASAGWMGRGLIYSGGLEGRVQHIEMMNLDAHLRVSEGIIADYRGRMDRCEADVNELECKVSVLRSDMDAAKQWQVDWEAHGMLEEDKRQNQELRDLSDKLSRLEGQIGR
jgi:outer membrane murein-binding lipoprotein Lpp